MRFKVFILIVFGWFNSLVGHAQTKIKLATYNLRYENTIDIGNLWSDRKYLVKDIVERYDFDIFGTQEALPNQVNDLITLMPQFAWTGGNKDGNLVSEYAAIFYKTSKFNLLSNGHFWLSDTPDVPGRAWDAAHSRVCSWAYFEEIATGYKFYVFDAHFDFDGTECRKNSNALVLAKIQAIAGLNPTLFCGDLNYQQYHPEYTTINNSGLLKDAFNVAAIRKNITTASNGFDVDNINTRRIDHIFVTNSIKVRTHDIVTDSYNGKMASDHSPVWIEFEPKTSDNGEIYWQFPEDFDSNTKSSYASAQVSFTTGLWTLSNAVIGTSSSNDRASSGHNAVRMNDNDNDCFAQMDFDVTEGASKVTVQHSIYGTTPMSKWSLQYSTDQGINWKNIGPLMYTNQSEKEQQATFYMDIAGPVRFRVFKYGVTGNGKLSIDDIVIYRRKSNASKQEKNVPLLAWQFDSPASNGTEVDKTATTINAGVEISTLVRGNGLTNAVTLTNSFAAKSNTETTHSLPDTTLAVANNLYYQFDVKAKPGYRLALKTLDASIFANENGAKIWYWKYSLDGINYYAPGRPFKYNASNPPLGSAISITTLDLTENSVFQNLTSDKHVYFRLYLIGANTDDGVTAIGSYGVAGTLNNALVLSGTVEDLEREDVPLLAWQFATPATNGNELTLGSSINDSGVESSVLYRGQPGSNTPTLSRAFVTHTPIATGAAIADTTAAVSNNLYFAFEYQSKANYKSSISTLNYKIRASAGGAKVYYWKYSLDNVHFKPLAYPFILASANTGAEGIMADEIDINLINELQNLAPQTKVYFRLYFNGSNVNSGTTALGRSTAATSNNYALLLQGKIENLNTLPITLISFTGKEAGNKNILQWETTFEENNKKFEVQRLNSQSVYDVIGSINALKSKGKYYFTDYNPKYGVNYYRLNQVDNDGSSNPSEAIAVSNTFISTMVKGYFSKEDELLVDINIPIKEKATINVVDITGKILAKRMVDLSEGNSHLVFDAKKWNQGVYVITVKGKNQDKNIKIIKK